MIKYLQILFFSSSLFDMKFSISEKHPEEHGGDKTLDVIETHGAPTCGTAHNCCVVYMIK